MKNSAKNALRTLLVPAGILMLLVVAAHTRNHIWRNTLALAEDNAGKAPGKERARISLGLAYYSRGLPDRAVEEYLAALALEPGSAPALDNLGVAYTALRRPNLAVECFETALKIVCPKSRPPGTNAQEGREPPPHAMVHDNLGNLYREQGRYKEALTQLTLALDEAPDKAQYFIDRGLIYLDLHRCGDAIADFTGALSLEPSSYVAYTDRGNAYDEAGASLRALEDFNRALSLKPDYANAYYNRGILYYRMRETDKAASDFRKACGLGGDLGCKACREYFGECSDDGLPAARKRR
jgi:tetratricopeptide (TPR) repeat protein